MKLNLVNLLATVLILGGVVLLVQRKAGRGTATPSTPITVEAARKDAVGKIEKQLGRPLNDAELQMIDATQANGQISITLRQPLSGRLRDSVAASQAAMVKTPTTVPGVATTEAANPG